jgi:hypothetical protein
MSRRTLRGSCVAVALAATVGTTVLAEPRWTWFNRPPLIAEHPVLSASLARLYAESPTWRAALNAVADTGRKIVVVTPDRVRVKDHGGGGDTPFAPDVIAEAQPLADDWSRVETVIVVVNLPLLDRLYSDATEADLADDLATILAHEVYGHAVPYVLAGHLSGKCADPLPRQRATEACAIKRENEIRNELRLGQRRGHGLDGLTIARRFRN